MFQQECLFVPKVFLILNRLFLEWCAFMFNLQSYGHVRLVESIVLSSNLSYGIIFLWIICRGTSLFLYSIVMNTLLLWLLCLMSILIITILISTMYYWIRTIFKYLLFFFKNFCDRVLCFVSICSTEHFVFWSCINYLVLLWRLSTEMCSVTIRNIF